MNLRLLHLPININHQLDINNSNDHFLPPLPLLQNLMNILNPLHLTQLMLMLIDPVPLRPRLPKRRFRRRILYMEIVLLRLMRRGVGASRRVLLSLLPLLRRCNCPRRRRPFNR